jgi:hypothetical protein
LKIGIERFIPVGRRSKRETKTALLKKGILGTVRPLGKNSTLMANFPSRITIWVQSSKSRFFYMVELGKE